MNKKLLRPKFFFKAVLAICVIWFVADAIQDTQATYYVEPSENIYHWEQGDVDSWDPVEAGFWEWNAHAGSWEWNASVDSWNVWEQTHDISWTPIAPIDADPWEPIAAPEEPFQPGETRPQRPPDHPPQFSEEFWTNHNRAMDTVRRINEHFTTETGIRIYPDYFGGMYINDDGNLVLLRVASATPPMPTFTYFTDALVRDVVFSFNELTAMMDFLDAYSSANPDLFNNLSGWGLDTVGNRVAIYLIDYSAEAIDDFRSRNEAFASNLLVFEQMDMPQAGPGISPPGVLPPPPGTAPPGMLLPPPGMSGTPGAPPPPEFWTNHDRAVDTARMVNEHFTTETGDIIYPDYFGGMYINNDGNLVLLRVASAAEPMPTFTYFADTLVRDVEFSFNELSAMMDFLDATRSTNPEHFINLSSWGLDTSVNRIVIRLLDYSAEAIDDFRSSNEAFASNMLTFEQGEIAWALPGPPGPPPEGGVQAPGAPGTPGAPGVPPGIPQPGMPGFEVPGGPLLVPGGPPGGPILPPGWEPGQPGAPGQPPTLPGGWLPPGWEPPGVPGLPGTQPPPGGPPPGGNPPPGWDQEFTEGTLGSAVLTNPGPGQPGGPPPGGGNLPPEPPGGEGQPGLPPEVDPNQPPGAGQPDVPPEAPGGGGGWWNFRQRLIDLFRQRRWW